MHASAHGREPVDGASPLPPAIRAELESPTADPGASGDPLEPFAGPDSSPAATQTDSPAPAEPDPAPPHDGVFEHVESEAVVELEDAPGFDGGDAPWEALGKAIDDALSRAAAAAAPSEEVPWTAAPIPDDDANDAGTPLMESAITDLEELALEDVAVFAGDLEVDEDIAAVAEDVVAAGAEEDLAAVAEDAFGAGADPFSAAPHLHAAEPADQAAAAEAGDLASRLEALAARLRLEGPEALDDALRSDDRAEALLAATLAGLRSAGVFKAGVPSS